MRKKSTAKAAAWKWCSRYIRRKWADENGYVKCVTCDRVDHWKNMDAGHFVSKSRGNSIYFEEENIAPQCQGCNRFQEGNKHIFTLFMIDMYGREKVEELEQLARQTQPMRLADYEALEAEFKAKCMDLEAVA